MDNLKIIFYLDGTGIIYYNEYIHLDSLIAVTKLTKKQISNGISQNELPIEFDLPLDKWDIDGYWGWKASVLFPIDRYETIQYFRKRFDVNRILKDFGSCNIQGGFYKNKNCPENLILTNKLIGYCRGNKKEIEKCLKKIKYLGKRRNCGKGKIIDMKINVIKNDYSIIKNNKAMRYLPNKESIRLVRYRPPYWHRYNRTNCCEIGEKYEI